jgi:hypothetical protein
MICIAQVTVGRICEKLVDHQIATRTSTKCHCNLIAIGAICRDDNAYGTSATE